MTPSVGAPHATMDSSEALTQIIGNGPAECNGRKRADGLYQRIAGLPTHLRGGSGERGEYAHLVDTDARWMHTLGAERPSCVGRTLAPARHALCSCLQTDEGGRANGIG